MLKLVLKEDEISSRKIEPDTLWEARVEKEEINRGNLTLEESGRWQDLEEKVFFHEYLLEYLGRYGQEKQESPLWYQTEYVIMGGDNDRENLKGVVNRIFIIPQKKGLSSKNKIFCLFDNLFNF